MAITAGSIAFVGFDADGTQRFAIVAVDPLPPGTVIYFTDRAWNGTAFQPGASEGTLTWTVPAGGIARGTLVSFDDVNAISTTTASTSTSNMDTSGNSVTAGFGS